MSKNPATLQVTRTKISTLQAVAEPFYLDRKASCRSETTLIWYRKYVGALVTWLTEHGVNEPEQVTLTICANGRPRHHHRKCRPLAERGNFFVRSSSFSSFR